MRQEAGTGQRAETGQAEVMLGRYTAVVLRMPSRPEDRAKRRDPVPLPLPLFRYSSKLPPKYLARNLSAAL